MNKINIMILTDVRLALADNPTNSRHYSLVKHKNDRFYFEIENILEKRHMIKIKEYYER